MIEGLLVYLIVGLLAAMAQGDWRLSRLARAMIIWPALLPRMIRDDPSPSDPDPMLASWGPRIRAALQSLESAVEGSGVLTDENARQHLLVDTEHELLEIAKRSRELEQVLSRSDFDIALLTAEKDTASSANLPIVRRRIEHVAQLHRLRASLDQKLESGLAEVMNLAARFHLARATGAPTGPLRAHLEDATAAIDGIIEVEAVTSGALDDLLD
ncbi:MAG: hypothetical protein QGG40_20425, partial [Myxococcota bacterium]|nr:hypothetical protein [Myxococcota bacterium]